MIDTLLGFIAPHYCISCAKIGTNLCDHCNENIISEPLIICTFCRYSLVNNTCSRCKVPYLYFGSFFKREGAVKQLLDQYKFVSVRPAVKVIALLFNEQLPYFPGDVVYVNIPTSRSHIRQRGFDHLDGICQELSRLRDVPYVHLLERKTNVRQVGVNKKQRLDQVVDLYKCRKQLDELTTYVLIDDVVTTGATLRAASQALYDAGARKIAAVSFAYQPSN